MVFNHPYRGNPDLLERPIVAFFASREVSPRQRLRALEWLDGIIRTGKVVAGGFHSPLEREILERLLAARHPVIWGHARALYRRYAPQVEQAIDEGRIFVFAARDTSRAGAWTAQTRNAIITSMADRSVFVINRTAGRSSLLDAFCDLERMSGHATVIE